jgi:hypothetical protein
MPKPGSTTVSADCGQTIARVAACVVWTFAPAAVVAQPDCQPVRFEILTPPLTSTPYIVLDAGGRNGPWLLDYGSTVTSVYQDAWKAEVGDAVTVSGLPLPGASPGPLRLPVVAGGRHRTGVGSPLGTLGTDVLSRLSVEFHLEVASDPHVIISNPACGSTTPREAGFVRTEQSNFFSSHPDTHTSGLPNVPVLSVELEERLTDRNQPRLPDPRRTARRWAQLDTGYSDTVWPNSVDINEAYLDELRASVPSLALAGLVPVSGCGREDTLREVYVAPGWRLNVVPDSPQRPIPFSSIYLVVKPRVTACGGIGPMSVPAAQLGSSFLRAFGTTVLLPDRSELWIKLPHTN